jgi:hypothetical protein
MEAIRAYALRFKKLEEMHIVVTLPYYGCKIKGVAEWIHGTKIPGVKLLLSMECPRCFKQVYARAEKSLLAKRYEEHLGNLSELGKDFQIKETYTSI